MPIYSGHVPTIPSKPPTFPVNEPHRARGMAEGFGEDPEQYDRARPRYPQAMADRILATNPGRQVLDVGIGTGIAARPFRAAGCQVLGVDVDARMAEFARQRGFKVEVAKFEEWGPEGRVFDLVIAGQTWHWVDPVAGAAKAADVLRAGGRLAVFWNVFGFPPGLGAALAQVYQRVLLVRRSSKAARAGWEPTQRCWTRRPTGFGAWGRLASPSGGSSIGRRSTPGTNGLTRYRRQAATVSSRRAN